MDGVLFTIPDWLDYADFNNYPSEENPTTNADFIDYANNQNILLGALVAAVLWQPNTNFIAGKIIISPNMPEGMEAVALTGGVTGTAEPAWEIDTEEYQDSGVKWKLRYKHWSKSVEEIADLTTGATNRLPNKAYAVGNVVYTDSNLSVALKCTTAGTTSNTELDISGASVGETVTDGTVVWQVCNRTSDVTSVNGKTGDVVVDTLPVGTIISYAGNTTPSGFLDCNGASLNPSTYVNLFNEIGTTYGGNGSTTFNLPNMGSKVISEVSTGNLAVKGNGKTLGLTNGSANGGFETYGYQGVTHLKVLTSNYNINVKSTNGAATTDPIDGRFGITTDGSKSGMIVSVTATKTTVKYCIKY